MTHLSKQIELFTDGACTGNPGPGGYGVILRYGHRQRELSGGYRRTTNNRMELMAVIKGLEALKEPCAVQLVSDSRYVLDGIAKGWAHRWRAGGWIRAKKSVPNWDLWHLVLECCGRHQVRVRWVEGHAGHVENERCDELAVLAAGSAHLDIDSGYEQPPVLPVSRRRAEDRRSLISEAADGARTLITEGWLDLHRTPQGAWTREQLAAIGVSWPPPRGWKRAAVGREISPEQQRVFEAESVSRGGVRGADPS